MLFAAPKVVNIGIQATRRFRGKLVIWIGFAVKTITTFHRTILQEKMYKLQVRHTYGIPLLFTVAVVVVQLLICKILQQVQQFISRIQLGYKPVVVMAVRAVACMYSRAATPDKLGILGS